jgi:hypothetical protein
MEVSQFAFYHINFGKPFRISLAMELCQLIYMVSSARQGSILGIHSFYVF